MRDDGRKNRRGMEVAGGKEVYVGRAMRMD